MGIQHPAEACGKEGCQVCQSLSVTHGWRWDMPAQGVPSCSYFDCKVEESHTATACTETFLFLLQFCTSVCGQKVLNTPGTEQKVSTSSASWMRYVFCLSDTLEVWCE